MIRAAAALLLLASACSRPIRDESALREAVARGGKVSLPEGTIEIHGEIPARGGLELVGRGPQSILRAAPDFKGRALIVFESAAGARLSDFAIDGSRESLEQRAGLPPYDVPFHRFTRNSGVLIVSSKQIGVSRVQFRRIAGFAILAAASQGIHVDRIRVSDSGSRNEAGRNNTTGGVLFEEGAGDFHVLESEFESIRGNAVWTHSLYTSPRNSIGRIAGNRFREIGRDAIQIGHATGVRVESNTGERIGYPEREIDVENKAVPVAIDTAGNVDRSVYTRNSFRDINGKCIDLDGFHHGSVTENTCVNQKNFGIVMNNTNPDMRPEGIDISGNTIDTASYGGIFVIGANNKILNNKLLNLNANRCETCYYVKSEPDMLRSGIYLGRGAERPAPATDNEIRGNTITGYRMKERCVTQAPGIPKTNRIAGNTCSDADPSPPADRKQF
jgi:hypothetical protein